MHIVLDENYDKYPQLNEYLKILKDGNMSIINEFNTLLEDYCSYLKKQCENICNDNEEINNKYEKASADLTEANQLLTVFVEYERQKRL